MKFHHGILSTIPKCVVGEVLYNIDSREYNHDFYDNYNVINAHPLESLSNLTVKAKTLILKYLDLSLMATKIDFNEVLENSLELIKIYPGNTILSQKEENLILSLVDELSKKYKIELNLFVFEPNDPFIYSLIEKTDINFNATSEVIFEHMQFYYKCDGKYYEVHCEEIGLRQPSSECVDQSIITEEFIILDQGQKEIYISKLKGCNKRRIDLKNLDKNIKDCLDSENHLCPILIPNIGV